LRHAGVSSSATLYAGARHELLNETNRDAVTADLVAWFDSNRG
jgi:alpha-beta hydrolase superfamily lysophospholipase